MIEKIIILGCGGHAKSVADTIEAEGRYQIAGFVDYQYDETFVYRGYKMIGCDAELQKIYDSGIYHACVGIGFMGKGNIRNRLYAEAKRIGFHLPAIIDPTAVLARDALIGEGTFIGKNAVINADAKIGKMAIINTGVIIEHDCIVGDYCHVAVGATVCGAVQIGAESMIGANATVIQGIQVGKNVIVGAGSVVVKDLSDSVTAVGVPAKIIKSEQ